MNYKAEPSVTSWPVLAILCLMALILGCDMPADPEMQLHNVKPKLDLLRLDFDRSKFEVDVQTTDDLCVFNDDWVLTLTPVAGEALINTELVLRRIVLGSGEAVYSRFTETDSKNVKVYRYLRGVKDEHFSLQGDYLVNIDGYWLSGSAFSRKTLAHFDQRAIDRFFYSLKLLDEPQADHEVLPAWQEYQRTRTADSADGKFSLYMDPAPICLGNYSNYLARLDASASYLDMTFNEEDYANGGRMIGDEILEFYSKGDPTSVRIDIWIDHKPTYKAETEKLYSNTLTVSKSPLDLWSFDEPFTLEIKPGQYEVEIVLINRGKHSEESLFDRDQFQRDDLERYEIYLTRIEGSAD